ncbi:hypothetical protein LEMA_P098860.1 [Plenodomus lingam JN3]|uniref:Myb-like domain-containing protein n=2 Tax=Leptosphaeria maculans TaxID=5022 RepID=E5A4D2_LEPMJ|nr:hypothetical protein LEMA_P098860.1 [Plenodomus lingam JN3]CBX98477.1 hypothetical protein LEMA_P098860.1 [Plenodomus lingam JN3]
MDLPKPGSEHPRGAKSHVSWTKEEEDQLLHLRNGQKMKYADIAKILSRSTNAVKTHHVYMKRGGNKKPPTLAKFKLSEQTYATIYWTDEIDAAIINGHRNHQNNKSIAASLHLPRIPIQERWAYLKSNNLVPTDVLALDGRRNGKPHGKIPVIWRREEDEAIWALWKAMKTDKEIAALFPFKGKSATAIRKRRIALVQATQPYGNGPEDLARKEGTYEARDWAAGKENLERLRKWVASDVGGEIGVCGVKGKTGKVNGKMCAVLGEKLDGANEVVVKEEEKDENTNVATVLGYHCSTGEQQFMVDKDGITEEEWVMAMGGAFC